MNNQPQQLRIDFLHVEKLQREEITQGLARSFRLFKEKPYRNELGMLLPWEEENYEN